MMKSNYPSNDFSYEMSIKYEKSMKKDSKKEELCLEQIH